MPFYDIFCFLNEEQKKLIKKNHHTLHFFCYYDNIKILKENEDYSNGYKYRRHITNKIADSFNIDYDLIKTYPMFLEYLIEEIIYDQIKLENILKDNPLALQYLPKIIYNYDHFCEIAVENNIAALQFAENLKNDL